MKARLPDPASAPELFEGILVRRVLAFAIDLALIGLITVMLSIFGLVAGFLTLGLAWLAMIVVIPAAIALYYAATLGSYRRATIGMQAMDIVLTPTRGAPLDGWKVLIHPLVFWITVWISWPISLIIALLTPRREMVHDLLVGTLMVRRSPMARHWAAHGRGASERI